MKIKYQVSDNPKKVIEIEVSAKVAHFLENEKKRQKKVFKKEKDIGIFSLEELMEDGFQPNTYMPVEYELLKQERERRYFNSNEYKLFRKNLADEIIMSLNKMSVQTGKAMILRFIGNLSISEIAEVLGVTKSTAQGHLSKGCGHISYFLDKDIEEQDKLEKERQIKRAEYYAFLRKNSKK